MNKESDQSETKAWFSSVYRRRLAYLIYLRLNGYEVDHNEIATLRSKIITATPTDEPLAHEVSELQDLLAFYDSVDAHEGQAIKATLHKLGLLKLRMRPERNHARPHFHIEYKREHVASYAVDTLELLAGSMPKKYEKPMLAWAKENQAALLETWNHINAGENVQGLIVIRNARRTN